MSIGTRIKMLRVAKGWPVAKLAREAGVAVNTLHNAEKGRADMLWGTAEQALSALGHVVLVVPKDANRVASSDIEGTASA